jgi:hypothetical protein
MKTKLTLILTAALLLTLTLPSTGCDRLIIISGTVYEWIEPPENAQSKIYHKEISSSGLLKEDFPEGITTEPLSDTHVRCYGEIPNDTYYSNEVTNEKGNFRLVISLGYRTEEYTTTVEVVRDGFISAKREVKDTGDQHSLNVLLVRKAD